MNLLFANAALFVLIAVPPLLAQTTRSTQLFRYQPDRIKVGTVYHYTKSNLDGTRAITVSAYIASKDRIEVFKTDPDGDDYAYVIADMNWQVFSAEKLNSSNVFKDGTRKPQAELVLSLKDNTCSVDVRGKKDSAVIGHYPYHVYNFDFMSLNFTFPHLMSPTKDFEVGIADPVFKDNAPHIFEYKGKAIIKYLSEEMLHGATCRKYQISGEAFENKIGAIWVHKTLNHVEKIEIPVADNPNWHDFKLELKRVEKMTAEEWANYRATNIGRQPFIN